ncbi:MAG: energy-coupling factor transporter ATPase [Clostridia bacterium]|nr:energy-coupling factor transporter ATPase [Clostridia bacterium]
MENKHLIEFNNVSFSYDEEESKVFALKNVSFTVDKGEFVVILGHNGSGKSTIAKLSNSIFVPAEGKVSVDGMDTSDEKNEFEIRKKVGVVFQNPDNQIVASIVEEDVAFGPENLAVEPEEIRKRVDDSLKAVGMYEYRMHETHRLSGGQKQRVAIAGIIAMQPDCIVLDEPTAMLDPKGRNEVMNTVMHLNREMGKSIVFITHFMEEAVNADKVLVVDNGRILLEGTPQEVFSQSKLLYDCGLTVPDVSALSQMLKKEGIEMGENILTEEDFVDSFLKLCGKNAVEE